MAHGAALVEDPRLADGLLERRKDPIGVQRAQEQQDPDEPEDPQLAVAEEGEVARLHDTQHQEDQQAEAEQVVQRERAECLQEGGVGRHEKGGGHEGDPNDGLGEEERHDEDAQPARTDEDLLPEERARDGHRSRQRETDGDGDAHKRRPLQDALVRSCEVASVGGRRRSSCPRAHGGPLTCDVRQRFTGGIVRSIACAW